MRVLLIREPVPHSPGEDLLISFLCPSCFPLVMTPGGFAISFRRCDNRREEVVKSKCRQMLLIICWGRNLPEEEVEPMLCGRVFLKDWITLLCSGAFRASSPAFPAPLSQVTREAPFPLSEY